jgi:hypothetical protein
MILEMSLIMLLIFILKHERDTSRTNFSKSIASKILPESFLAKHKKWFTNNNWDDTNLFVVDPNNKYEWDNFIVKNVLTFLNDYWKWNEFWLMLIVSYGFAVLAGYWWLMFPYFIVGGGIHSLFDGSLFRNFKK